MGGFASVSMVLCAKLPIRLSGMSLFFSAGTHLVRAHFWYGRTSGDAPRRSVRKIRTCRQPVVLGAAPSGALCQVNVFLLGQETPCPLIIAGGPKCDAASQLQRGAGTSRFCATTHPFQSLDIQGLVFPSPASAHNQQIQRKDGFFPPKVNLFYSLPPLMNVGPEGSFSTPG